MATTSDRFLNRAPRPALPAGASPRTDFKNILIVRLSSVGDVIFALPALETLRAWYPEAKISWVVEDRSASILEGHPFIDELIVMPRKTWRKRREAGAGRFEILGEMRRFGRSLRDRRFDLAIDFQGNIKSGLVTWASGAPLRLGLGRSETKEPNWLFTNRRLELDGLVLHRSERDLMMLTLIDLPYAWRWPTFSAPDADRAFVDRFLETLPHGKKLCVLHPGTSAWGPHKRWPTAYYAALGDRLIEHENAVVVLNWGPGEEPLLDEIEAQMKHRPIRVPLLANMRQVAAFVQRADLVVGSDTGPTHLAALLRRNAVTLFGPYDPRYYYPYQHADRAHFAAIPCAPCRYRGCAARDCMRLLFPTDVYETCRDALAGRSRPLGALTPNKTVRV